MERLGKRDKKGQGGGGVNKTDVKKKKPAKKVQGGKPGQEGKSKSKPGEFKTTGSHTLKKTRGGEGVPSVSGKTNLS